jgi:TctA family transporter
MTKERKENLCLGWVLVSITIFLLILIVGSNLRDQEIKEQCLYALLFFEFSTIGGMFCLWRTSKIKENE